MLKKNKFLKELFFDSLLIFILIFILNIQIIFFGKTYLTYGAFEVMEGVKSYSGFTPREITVIDPAGSTWIDFPLSQITSRKILNGKIPLWNEFSGGGKPLAANQTSNAFSLIRYIIPVNIFPSVFMWDLFLIFRFFLISFLSYIFFRLVNLGRLISIIISISLAFSGHFLYYSNLFHLDVEVFFPLLLIGVEFFIKKNKIYVIIVPLSIFLTFIGGNIQSSIVNLISFFLYFLLRILFFNFCQNNKQKFSLKSIFFFIILLFIGIGLSFFYLIIFIEFYINSFHVHSTFTGIQSFSIKTLPALIFPFIYGPVHSQWYGLSQHLIPSYVGIFTSFIFFYGLLTFYKEIISNRPVLISIIIFALFFLKIFNIFPFLNKLIIYLPILNRIIFTKYLFPFYFFFYFLVGFFVSNLIDENKIKKINYLIAFIVIISIFFIGLMQIIKYEQDLATKYIKLNYIFKHSGSLFLLFIFYSMILVLFSNNLSKLKKVVLISIFIFCEIFFASNILIRKKIDRYDIIKNSSSFVNFLMQKQKTSDSSFRIYGVERILMSQIPSTFGLEDLRDMDALNVKKHNIFMREFITGYDSGDYSFYTGGNNFLNYNSLYFLASSNVKYLLDHKNNRNSFVLKWEKEKLIKPVYSDFGVIIFEINHFKPRVYFPKKVILSDKSVELMKKNYFNPINEVVINDKKNKTKDKIIIHDLKRDWVNIKEYGGDYLKIESFCYSNVNGCYLFIGNTYYPGWTAHLSNGQELNIEMANYAFQAIKVPYGFSKIIVKYDPFTFRIGLFFSLIFFLIWICIIKINYITKS